MCVPRTSSRRQLIVKPPLFRQFTGDKVSQIMGTREVHEEKLRNGNLYHYPTINPGLGSPRCPRCLSLLTPNSAGSGMGGMLSAVYGFNTGIPYLQNRLKGPKWLPFLVGLPPLLIFSGASAAFGVIF